MAEVLSSGNPQTPRPKRFRLSPVRISEIRRELKLSWEQRLVLMGLLGHQKSWVSRRLALLEKLCLEARED